MQVSIELYKYFQENTIYVDIHDKITCTGHKPISSLWIRSLTNVTN